MTLILPAKLQDELIEKLKSEQLQLAEQRLLGLPISHIEASTVVYDKALSGVRMPIENARYYHCPSDNRLALFRKFARFIKEKRHDFEPFAMFLVSEDKNKDNSGNLIISYLTVYDQRASFFCKVERMRHNKIKRVGDPEEKPIIDIHNECMKNFFDAWDILEKERIKEKLNENL